MPTPKQEDEARDQDAQPSETTHSEHGVSVPPMEAVLAHAKSLGVFLSDPMTPADQALLEIAKESLTAPLPEGWQIGDKGCFVNKYNGDLLHEHPMDDYYRIQVTRLQGTHNRPAMGNEDRGRKAGDVEQGAATIDSVEVDRRVQKAVEQAVAAARHEMEEQQELLQSRWKVVPAELQVNTLCYHLLRSRTAHIH